MGPTRAADSDAAPVALGDEVDGLVGVDGAVPRPLLLTLLLLLQMSSKPLRTVLWVDITTVRGCVFVHRDWKETRGVRSRGEERGRARVIREERVEMVE